ncbi:Lrp/AsnC family transcriptional regulator [Streptomyces sp. NBC_01635]|uniref:Lrp/AsnC family transcriptional regulator n=1 Tax=Streptomyces sp. NBC_01635 TaxID=2975904 RepID=UPI003869DA61|nr:Lrp/AsnC family transcriptional regulator [Streptomyces sp. NBC_01635]
MTPPPASVPDPALSRRGMAYGASTGRPGPWEDRQAGAGGRRPETSCPGAGPVLRWLPVPSPGSLRRDQQASAPSSLGSLDLKLLQALELDGRASFSRIAQVLGVSDQTVARRFRRLRTTVNLRVTDMTDESRLGRDGWIVRLGCSRNTASQLAGAIAGRPDTHYVDLAAGGTEVVCAISPRSSRERDGLLLERLPRIPHVTSVGAHCVLRSYYGSSLRRLRKINAHGAAWIPRRPRATVHPDGVQRGAVSAQALSQAVRLRRRTT